MCAVRCSRRGEQRMCVLDNLYSQRLHALARFAAADWKSPIIPCRNGNRNREGRKGNFWCSRSESAFEKDGVPLRQHQSKRGGAFVRRAPSRKGTRDLGKSGASRWRL